MTASANIILFPERNNGVKVEAKRIDEETRHVRELEDSHNQ